MNLVKRKKSLGLNIFYILLYIVFLFVFPSLRNYFNSSDISLGAPQRVLHTADKSTNLVSRIFNNLKNYFSYKKYLINEIEILKRDLEVEKQKNSVIQNTQNDNNDFSATSSDLVIAKKIFSDWTTIYSTILLDKGSDDKVEIGDIVFLYGDKVVGEISEVNPKTSIATLFSKDKNKLEAVVKGKENKSKTVLVDSSVQTLETSTSTAATSSSISAISFESKAEKLSGANILIDVYGYGGGDFVARIPENIEISTGTMVYLARDESKTIGEIVKIEKQDASFFQILLIRGYYNTRMNDTYYIKRK